MAPTSLDELRALKRTELQALCKENDIKANGKTDALIDALASKFGLCDAAAAAATPAANVAPKKSVPSASAKGKGKTVIPSASAHAGEIASTASTAAASAGLVQSTSPAPHTVTLEAFEDLASAVDSLEGRLAAATTTIANLQAAPVSLSPEAVEALIEQKIAQLAAGQDKDVAERNERIAQLEARVAEQDELFNAVSADLDALSNELPHSCKACEALEATVDTLRRNLLSRLDTLEARPIPPPVAPVLTSVKPASAPKEQPQQRSRAVSFASPALSDAPPTQSLLSFDSPAGSPATPAQDSPFVRRQSVGLRKATPFKLGAPAAAAEETPGTAVPPHMLAAAASAARRTQRASLLATPAAGEPESPAPPTPNAALGKHARYSDASNQSVVIAAGGSPEQPRAATPFESEGFFTAPNSVKKLALGEQSAKREAHARKKVRVSPGTMSTGTTIDHSEDARGFFFDDEGGDDEEPVDSFARNEPEVLHANEEDVVAEGDDEQDEHEQVRDYLVATKTGDSPAPALSVHDPGFFATAAGAVVSPARSTAGLRAFSLANENTRPASPAPAAAVAGRKSLPLAALPFPLVSPFRAAAPSTAPPAAGGTASSARKGPPSSSAAKISTIKTFFGDASNRSSAAASFSATGGAGLFASATGSASAKKQARSRAGTSSAGAPPTPLAPRTLFGTESDGAGRFGEGGVDAGDGASPAKGWMWERGAFSAGAF
ncbi:hypothetical protein JCM3770_005505 [Rhodotorula araucariae]